MVRALGHPWGRRVPVVIAATTSCILLAVGSRMENPYQAIGLLAVAGLLVKPLQDAMLGLFSRKTTAKPAEPALPAEPAKPAAPPVLVKQEPAPVVGVSFLSPPPPPHAASTSSNTIETASKRLWPSHEEIAVRPIRTCMKLLDR